MYKILVVDDEPEIVNILKEFLTKMGFEVMTALGGDEAMQIINSQTKIDLMLMDMKMPRMRGIDILKEMKKLSKEIPVIILTGSVDVKKHAEDLGKLGYSPEDIIIKPVDLYLVLNMVKKRLGLN